MHDALRPNALITDDLGRHPPSCDFATLRGQRSYRGSAFSTTLAEVVFENNKLHSDGLNKIEKEPNLGNLGIVPRNPLQPPPLAGNHIVRADWLLTRPNGRRTLVDFTTTCVVKADMSRHPNAAVIPGYAANGAVRRKTRQYNAKWVLPQDLPLVIAAFELTGRWHKDTVDLVDSYLSNKFPDKDRNADQSHGFAMALDYARKCISVTARICVANAIMAMVVSAHKGVLVPVDRPAL